MLARAAVQLMPSPFESPTPNLDAGTRSTHGDARVSQKKKKIYEPIGHFWPIRTLSSDTLARLSDILCLRFKAEKGNLKRGVVRKVRQIGAFWSCARALFEPPVTLRLFLLLLANLFEVEATTKTKTTKSSAPPAKKIYKETTFVLVSLVYTFTLPFHILIHLAHTLTQLNSTHTHKLIYCLRMKHATDQWSASNAICFAN